MKKLCLLLILMGAFRITKYCLNASEGDNGFKDGKDTLEPEDDVAHIELGSNWRLPTQAEVEELLDNCKWEWDYYHGVQGYRVTSNVPGYTDRSIFLPAAGFRGDTGVHKEGTDGRYWTSVLHKGALGPSFASCLSIHAHLNSVSDDSREYGLSIRPVCGK